MQSTLRNSIVGTLVSVLACTTGLAAPNTHTATLGGKDKTTGVHKTKHHKDAGKKHHRAHKAGHKKHHTKARKHTGKKHHRSHRSDKPAGHNNK